MTSPRKPHGKVPLLFAWDLGANRGHVTQLLDLKPALLAAGFSIHAAVNRVRDFGQQLADEGVTVLQSPSSEPPPGPRLTPLSLAHIFHNRGYADPDQMTGMVEAWRTLMQLTKARLILADGAPPALIAARTLGLPVANLSTPFHVPPSTPSFLPFSGVGGAALDLEQALDACLPAVFSRYDLPAPARFVDLFNTEDAGFFCLPELDAYGVRPGQNYRGPLFGAKQGKSFSWPQAGQDAPQVFAYLPAKGPAPRAVLATLARLKWPVVGCCPGFSKEADWRHLVQTSPTLSLHEDFLDIHQAGAEANLALGNASLAFTHAMLLAGKPLLLMPNDSEKHLIAQRVVAMGAGLIPSMQNGDGYVGALNALTDNAEYANAARAFASNYAAHDMGVLAQQFAEHCRTLLASQPVAT